MVPRRVVLVVPLVAVLTAVGSTVLAQDSLQSARAFYASAEYENALKVLTGLSAAERTPEVEQYRVSCLVALGRVKEATKVVESVVLANPSYVPDPTDVPPRIVELFGQTRKALLPDVARKMYAEAKAALDRSDREAAISGFSNLVTLTKGTDQFGNGLLSELRLLALGFLDLSRALPAPAPAAPSPAPPDEPRKAGRPPDITPPVAIKQAMPAWIPPDAVSRGASFAGSVRVMISASGRVDSAEIVRSVHPQYDRLLLQAARLWEYQPARSDGVAVPSEQVVQVQLKPRE
jgi:TonB family protein